MLAVSDLIAVVSWGMFGNALVVRKDIPPGPPLTLAHYMYQKCKSVSSSRGTHLFAMEQQTLLEMENGARVYTPWRIQQNPDTPAIQRGHCALTSADPRDCNCRLVADADCRDGDVRIETLANRLYKAWSLVLVDYGWPQAWKEKHNILNLNELDFLRYLAWHGINKKKMEAQVSSKASVPAVQKHATTLNKRNRRRRARS